MGNRESYAERNSRIKDAQKAQNGKPNPGNRIDAGLSAKQEGKALFYGSVSVGAVVAIGVFAYPWLAAHWSEITKAFRIGE